MFSWLGLRRPDGRREAAPYLLGPDVFATVEADIRAMVTDPRWEALPVHARAQAIAARTLVTHDGDRWLFGAHARWHLLDPADGRWHPAAPPHGHPARRVEHTPGALHDHLLPHGVDFAADRGSTQAFVGPDVPPDLTEQVRVLLRANGRRSEDDFPLTAFGEIFAKDVPSTVAAIWGTVMWCAYAPAFDGNERLITIFGEYLGRPLPGDEWVRWLPAPRLCDLATLYAERIRAGKPRAALRLAALIADTAHILAMDARFRPRAAALVAMVEPALEAHGLDDRAAQQDDEAVRHAWLARCPGHLTPAVLMETEPGRHFAHVVYDLVEALSFAPDPIHAAATFLADLPDRGGRLSAWLEHRLRHAHHHLTPTAPPLPTDPPRAGSSHPTPTGPPPPGSSHPTPTGPPVPPPSPGSASQGSTGAQAPGTASGRPAPGALSTGAWFPEETGAWAPPSDSTGAWSPTDRTDPSSPAEATGAWSPTDRSSPLEVTGAFPPPYPMRAGGSVPNPVPVRPAVPDPARDAGTDSPWGGAVSELALEPPDRGAAAAVLGAAYAVGLAWCRLSEAEVPAKGFAGASAMVHRLMHERDDPHLNH